MKIREVIKNEYTARMAFRTYRSDCSINYKMDHSVNMSRRWKSIIALLISAVIGFASAFLSGQFDTATILKSIAIAFSISQVFYDQVFKDLFNKPDNDYHNDKGIP